MSTMTGPHGPASKNSLAKREVKRRPLAGARLDPDLAAVAFDDAFANGQADAVAGVFRRRMDAFEDAKNPLLIAVIKTDAIVPDAEVPVTALAPFGLDVNARLLAGAKLDGVAD